MSSQSLLSHWALCTFFTVTLLTTLVHANTVYARADAGYAPIAAQCPSGSLVRAASSINQDEVAYVTRRKVEANKALRGWLAKTGLKFDTASLPIIALATSGGGYRSMLSGAGVVQAMDGTDSSTSTSGLYQALTYHAGLSGGSWLLGSLVGNSGDTRVSALQKDLWIPALKANSIWPTNILISPEGPLVRAALEAKQNAGFDVTVPDTWGRFLSFQLLRGGDGGAGIQLSEVLKLKDFDGAAIPFPIISALLKTGGISGDSCDAVDDSSQIEFTPYETGSWDRGIGGFTPTEFLGTDVVNGSPVGGKCIRDFDNLGYLFGASSARFGESCGLTTTGALGLFLLPFTPADSSVASQAITGQDPARRNLYAPIKNPFKGNAASSLVKNDAELYVVDGGSCKIPSPSRIQHRHTDKKHPANQNNPIWPFIQPHRNVDVIIVNDNSADTDDNWPNGTEILHTYTQAQAHGLTKMPSIPPPSDIVSRNLNKQAFFLGCHDKNKVTIVVLPNQKWDYDSNVSTTQFSYAASEIMGLIGNGNLIATQGGDAQWPVCLACALTHKKSRYLPQDCGACLEKYCVTG